MAKKIIMKFLLIPLYIMISWTIIDCSSQNQIVPNEKIEVLKIDDFKFPKKDFPIIQSKYEVFVYGCIPYFPECKVQLKSLELLDTNEKIVPAELIGGEKAIESKIVYPELAKRAEIEGLVLLSIGCGSSIENFLLK